MKPGQQRVSEDSRPGVPDPPCYPASSMLTRRLLLLGGTLSLLGLATPRTARATLARALPLAELLHLSRHTVVGTPLGGFSAWEEVGGRRRIVTYTTVRVDACIDGRPPLEGEFTVRTLGGTVGEIGQVVAGEARLDRGRPAALFVEDLSRDLFAVTAMAQGHFPLQPDPGGVTRLRRGASLAGLVGGKDAAVRRLDGLTVLEAERLIATELTRARP